MSIFMCEKCKCVENTATSNYWSKDSKSPTLCSECDPEIGIGTEGSRSNLLLGICLGLMGSYTQKKKWNMKRIGQIPFIDN